MVNENSVDYQPSPSQLKGYNLSYFYVLLRVLFLSRLFVNFLLQFKPEYPTMVRKFFLGGGEVYDVQIAGKCICEPKIESRHFYFSPQAKLSPRFLSSPPGKGESLIFRESVPPVERGKLSPVIKEICACTIIVRENL